jgi:hypothetical protein
MGGFRLPYLGSGTWTDPSDEEKEAAAYCITMSTRDGGGYWI